MNHDKNITLNGGILTGGREITGGGGGAEIFGISLLLLLDSLTESVRVV